jgi:Fe-S-cluster containining protein
MMRRSKLKRLHELYAKVPNIECKGLCHTSCTLIPASNIEGRRAKDRLGTNPFRPLVFGNIGVIKGKIPSCRALKNNKCSIYLLRPTICRLFGVVEGLRCPYGCEPKVMLASSEAHAIIREVNEL